MTINCNGKLIDLESPKIMGILNVTPDSFYDGGSYSDETSILRQTEAMLKQGATFIDVGAYSSRPGADDISEEEELQRIEPVIALLRKNFPNSLISVDTFRSGIAKKCLEAGATMINDISGGDLDPEMFSIIAEFNVPFIMMHMRGTPQNMMEKTHYDNLINEIRLVFSEKIDKARKLKINDIIIDPGFGFSKTLSQNFQLLKYLDLLNTFEAPVLVGLSRKSMIYKTLDTDAEHALNGTTALNMFALNKGANILRVHDVEQAVECVKLYEEIRTS